MKIEITPSRNNIEFQAGESATLVDALDYAATGATGANFFTGRGEQSARLNFMAAHDLDRLIEIADENELRKSIA